MSGKHSNGVLSVKLGEQLLCADNEPSQSVRGEYNLAVRAHGRKENVPVSKLKFGRLFSEIASVVHPLASCSKHAEQANDNEPSNCDVNGLTKSVSVPFLPSASFERQVA